MQSGKRDRGGDAQLTREARIRVAGGGLRLIRFFDDALGSLVEALTGCRGKQPLCRAEQQLYAQALLDLRDHPRDSRLSKV